MGWARLDDNFHDHPKVDGCSLAAIGLWTLCWSWANRHRRKAIVPGHVPESRVRKAAGKDTDRLARELVMAQLWEESPLGGWQFHDFADYLPKERDPEERKEAGRKGASTRWERDSKLPSTSHEVDSKPVASGMASDSSRASAPAFPTRPDPYPSQTRPEKQDLPLGNEVAHRPEPDLVLARFKQACQRSGRTQPTAQHRNKIVYAAKRLLAEGVPLDELLRAADAMASTPYDDLDRQVNIARLPAPGRGSTTTERVNQGRALTAHFARLEGVDL